MTPDPTRSLYIAVEGPIGVGKTTLVSKLAEKLQSRIVLEEFEENPFLASFYLDRERYAFQTQIFFLMSRFKQQRDLHQTDLFRPHIVSDYHLLKDRIFAGLTLDPHELQLYDTVYRALEEQILKPDVMVYLRANQSTLLERIARRGRDYEKDFDPDYLMSLSRAYADFFKTYRKTPMVEVDTTELDVPGDPQAIEWVLNQIQAAVSNDRTEAINAPGRSPFG